MTDKDPTRIKTTVNLHSDEVEILERMAKQRGVSKTDILRAAIRTDGLLADEEARGGKVLIKEADGSLKQLVFRR